MASQSAAEGERVRRDINLPGAGCRALGLCVGAVTLSIADAFGDTRHGWRVFGLVRLGGMTMATAINHVARVYANSPASTRLIIGSRDLRDGVVALFREAACDLTAVIINDGDHAYRGADGTWRLPIAALKVTIVAAWGTEKLHLAGCEEAAAFLLAADRLRQTPGATVPDADLIIAVALAMWGAIEQSVTKHRVLPPVL
jgi:hypothetical protein